MLKLKLKPLALSSMLALSLAAGTSHAAGGEGIVLKEVASSDGSYCHIKYMAFTEQSLRSGQPEFDRYSIIDRYSSCNFDPQSEEEVSKQVALMNRGFFGDSGSDSGSE